VPREKLTPLVQAKVDAMLELLKGVQSELIGPRTASKWKKKLRKILELPSRAFIDPNHPQIRYAIEYVAVRKGRSDRCTLRSAKHLRVVLPPTGELMSIEDYLKWLCQTRKAAGAASCHRALERLRYKHRVIKQVPSKQSFWIQPCTADELPSKNGIARFLRLWRGDRSDLRHV
jgi:hypothetical protein